jgi:hypothetical protein
MNRVSRQFLRYQNPTAERFEEVSGRKLLHHGGVDRVVDNMKIDLLHFQK